MIVLDTNVVSELMREVPHSRVLEWARGEPSTSLYTTTITEAEVFYGLAVLPRGRRRADLEAAAERVFQAFAGRIWTFDSSAAREFAMIVAARRQAGRPVATADAQIAAIARAAGARIATRDTHDFAGCSVECVDPWR